MKCTLRCDDSKEGREIMTINKITDSVHKQVIDNIERYITNNKQNNRTSSEKKKK